MIKTILHRLLKNKDLIEPVEFVIKVGLVYAFWRLLKYSGETYPGFLWGGWAVFYDFMGNILASASSFILDTLGYKFLREGRVVVIEGTRGILIADLCLGIAPMFIFSGIILAFGNNWVARLWFIPMGIAIILIINVLRVLALMLVQKHYPQYFKIAHEYIYLIVTYSFIFLLLVWWMNRFAFKTNSANS